PEDDNRRLFLPVKNNLARLGHGVAFRLDQRTIGDPAEGIVASSILWGDEPVTVTADQALAAAGGTGRERDPTATNDAVEFLRDILAQGRAQVAELEAAARAAGLLDDDRSISQSKPFRNARKVLGVEVKPGIWSGLQMVVVTAARDGLRTHTCPPK